MERGEQEGGRIRGFASPRCVLHARHAAFAPSLAAALALLVLLIAGFPADAHAAARARSAQTPSSVASSSVQSPQSTPAALQTAPPAPTPSAQNAPEMSTTDHDATLHVRSNLVLVRVVVRDGKGNTVSGLTKNDFALYDEHKPQTITQFTTQIAGKFPASNGAASTSGAPSASESAGESAGVGLPQRYIGLYFDDIHISLQDLGPLRLAALRYVTTVLRPEDRAGVFTSSGELQQDFTSDREKIAAAIRRILPRPLYNQPTLLCPDIGPYQAWLIAITSDANAIEAAAREIVHCQYNDNLSQLNQARTQAIGLGQTELEQSNNEELYVLRGLDGLVRRMASLPGERTAILLSPGFLSRDDLTDVSNLIDHALHSSVTIHSLDVRGLYTPPMMGDISQDQGITPISVGAKANIENDAAQVYSEPLAQIAYGTGGTLFQNSNDIDVGFRVTAGVPGESYLLAFVPPASKKSGEYHTLVVKLNSPALKGYEVKARPGYFTNKPSDSQSSIDEEIAEAVYSQQPFDELPFDVHTRFYSAGASGHAVLSVMAHLDTRSLHFHKQEGRSLDNLTLVTALFDSDGNYLKGQEKIVEFRLRDATLASLETVGITLKSSFDVKTGRYTVRSVVRDANGPSLAAATRTVEIP
jgi:VWFA-related protein